MATDITTFPITTTKVSELPAEATFTDDDNILITAGDGVSRIVTGAVLRTWAESGLGAMNVGAGPVTAGSATIGGRVVQTVVDSGVAALGVASIASATSQTINIVSANVLATDIVIWCFSSDPTAVVGYAPTSAGSLQVVSFCSAGSVNVAVMNSTAASITPGAISISWKVVR